MVVTVQYYCGECRLNLITYFFRWIFYFVMQISYRKIPDWLTGKRNDGK